MLKLVYGWLRRPIIMASVILICGWWRNCLWLKLKAKA